MTFAWDLHEICMRIEGDLNKIHMRFVQDLWLTDWVSDRPGSRDVYTSKNGTGYAIILNHLELYTKLT